MSQVTKKIQITPKEKRELEERLDNLIQVKRPENIERIQIARSYGDLSENSEYDAAKDEQRLLEKEIKDLTELLRNVEIIDVSKIEIDRISIGKTVTLFMGDTQQEETYSFVGSQPKIELGKITIDSPLGQAVLMKKAGETAIVNAPNGEYEVKIISVEITEDTTNEE